MKTIFFVRHSKATHENENTPADAERLLTETGVLRTYLIGNYLIDAKANVDSIVTSPAKRTYSTALILSDKLGVPQNQISMDEVIYKGDAEDIVGMMENFDESINNVMIVGHNPTITEVVNKFIENKIASLPTTGVVSVNVEAEKWCDLKKAGSKQNFAVWPGML